jgi:hypothetical protein
VSWSTRFDEPIKLPDGRKLITLKDAGNYITKLPKAEHDAAEWQAAMEALLLVATLGGPDDVRADRYHAGDQPAQARRVRSLYQAPTTIRPITVTAATQAMIAGTLYLSRVTILCACSHAQ